MIDPRIADRRRNVLETGARRGVKRAIALLVVVTLLAAIAWVLQSPVLSVNEIAITGSNRDDVFDAIAAAGLEEGTPLIMVRSQRVEDSLVSLPWVRTASVERVFPDRVEVVINQRAAVAWLWTSGTYALLDVEGIVLEYQSDPPGDAIVLQLSALRLDPGEAHVDAAVQGGLQFAAVMVGSSERIVVREEAGELAAVVDGHDVRLGRPVDMAAKASALLAVLADSIPAGSSINLIAPTRPAVTP